MLGMTIVAVWTAFVCCYLIWQQLSGDFEENARALSSRRPHPQFLDRMGG